MPDDTSNTLPKPPTTKDDRDRYRDALIQIIKAAADALANNGHTP